MKSVTHTLVQLYAMWQGSLNHRLVLSCVMFLVVSGSQIFSQLRCMQHLLSGQPRVCSSVDAGSRIVHTNRHSHPQAKPAPLQHLTMPAQATGVHKALSMSSGLLQARGWREEVCRLLCLVASLRAPAHHPPGFSVTTGGFTAVKLLA